MKLKTLIVDDEPLALDKLRSYVEKVPFLELTAQCESAFEAIEYISNNDVHLVLTDINMPDLNGLEFIESLSSQPMVIFTTAHSQYAVDSYRLSAVDYLLKPYGFIDFQRAANKALEIYNARHPATPHHNESLFVKVDMRYVRVPLASIRFIKNYGEYLQLYLADSQRPLLTLSSLNAIRDKLSPAFLQVHRSYLVNMNHVVHIERNRIMMEPDIVIPIGDGYRADFQQYLLSHAIGRK